MPGVWVRPYGAADGEADDHLHSTWATPRSITTPDEEHVTERSTQSMQQRQEVRLSSPSQRLGLAAMGMEAEFALVVDGEQKRPEDVFGTPRDFIRGELMHRQGTSYHLPTGGAVYFDTGVIEVATPVIEIEKGCAARAGRSLWESSTSCATSWTHGTGDKRTDSTLVGFSAHYNVSFDLEPGARRTVARWSARAAAHARAARADDAPRDEPPLHGYRRAPAQGPHRDHGGLHAEPRTHDRHGHAPRRHHAGGHDVGALRPGQLAERHPRDPRVPAHAAHVAQGLARTLQLLSANPFTCDVDAPTGRHGNTARMSLRDIAGRIVRQLLAHIRRLSDPFTFRLIGSVVRGRSPSLLELDDRPEEYEDVGRLCTWDNLFPAQQLARSRYERVLIRAISGRRLQLGRRTLTPVGMSGWSAVVFRGEDGQREVISIDELTQHLSAWEQP
jgi:hypothetical protein